jgi:hypothetical protein
MAFWYDEPIGREERREACLYPYARTSSKDIKDDDVEVEGETNAERALRRAKSKIRKLIMTMKANRMLTLTFRDNVVDAAEAHKLFVRFIKAVHKEMPNWQYVSVAERQKRGAWHFHIAVAGFQNVKLLRTLWTKLVDGNIDVTGARTRGDKKAASAMIAGYLTKYMTKAFNENYEHGKYRYRASNGIKLNERIIWIPSQTWADAQKDVANLMTQTYGQVGAFYFSDDWNNGWFASWSFTKRRDSSKAPSANFMTS